MARHMDQERFTIEVAYVLAAKDALVPALREVGVGVHLLEQRHPADPRWLAALRRLVRSSNIDVVHTHAPYVASAARTVLPRSIPLVHTEHNLWSRYRWPTRYANATTYGRNDAVIAVSRSVATSIRPPRWIDPPPVEVIHHGADLAAVAIGEGARERARRRLALDASDVVVGTVANFTEKKDHATLLHATAALVPTHPRLRLVLVGTGPLQGQLEALARELGVANRVVFTGIRDDVLEILPAFDAFVLSSRYEGLPIALLEAMASGVPCVSTNVGGIPEVITDGVDGRLVPAGSPEALAEATAWMLAGTARRERFGTAARERAQAFDLALATRRTQAVYLRCLRQGRP
jgi:glycosyltransferase involved in cell wall biosynthesis